MPKCSWLLLSIGTPFLPTCIRNLPSCVNFSTMPSPWPLPPIHTLPLWSMVMPWFEPGH